MKRAVTRHEITEVLRRWQAGSLSAKDVHAWADDLYFPDLEFDDREGREGESVANEVLSSLSMLDMNLMTVEDVPLYLEFLDAPRGSFAESSKRFKGALERLDYQARRQALRNDPLYARYCAQALGNV